MKVLIACEYSGTVRDCFDALGHDAWSCDLVPSETRGNHIIGDALDVIYGNSWDLVIAHPPCTYLSVSGLHWNKNNPERAAKTEKALEFITAIWNAPVSRLCIENPVGCINTRLNFMPKPQYVQPYEFGDDASKKTGLWLRGLEPLVPGDYVAPRFVGGKPRWANQTDSGQNNLSSSQARERARTYFGIAAAMALQWG